MKRLQGIVQSALGHYNAPPSPFSPFLEATNTGNVACKTPCYNVREGGCKCQDRSGNFIKCNCPGKISLFGMGQWGQWGQGQFDITFDARGGTSRRRTVKKDPCAVACAKDARGRIINAALCDNCLISSLPL